MVQPILQFFIALSLVSGVGVGETIASKVFGLKNKWYLNLLDMLLFITIIILVMERVYLPENNLYLIIGINFFMGLTTLMISRGVTTGFGLLSKKVKDNFARRSEINEETYIIGLVRNLLNNKMSEQLVKRVLENSGFNKKKVNQVIKNLFQEDFSNKSSAE